MTSLQRREQLIEVGRSLFAAKGFEAVSVEEIAAHAKVSKPIVYEHFGGKEGLYAVIVDREMRALTGTLTAALDDPTVHPRQIVERTALALLTYIEENAEGFQVLVRDSPSTDPSGSFSSLMGDIAVRVEDILSETFKRQKLSAKGVPYYAQMLVGMTVFTGQYWADRPKVSKEQLAAYNMESYLDRCVNSLLSASDISDLEVLIVDDGSKDGTLEYAHKLERTNPGAVRAIHQENKGHGGAVNTGIAAATGMYVKVVDADDWVDPQAIDTVLATLRAQHDTDEPIDMLVTNYVYDKVAKRHKTVVNFRRVMEAGRVLGWDDLGKFGLAQYIIMHALTFRTQVVRDSGLKLPEHTFYVDFYYSYQPFPWVKRIQYLDVPFYHYFIGREGQSVQTDVMIKRVDQLRLVNRLMTEATPERGTVPEGLYRYMIHFLAIESCVTSTFLILSRDPANYVKKTELWDAIDAYSPAIGKDVRSQLMSRALNLPGKTGRWIVRNGYLIAERIVGFN